jgi:hypothetical protein
MKTNEENLKAAKELFERCLHIMETKNHDYASSTNFFKNLSLSEYLGVAKTENGIVTRLLDKIIRICNGIQREYSVKDEKIDDTILDAINYLALLYLYLMDQHK